MLSIGMEGELIRVTTITISNWDGKSDARRGNRVAARSCYRHQCNHVLDRCAENFGTGSRAIETPVSPDADRAPRSQSATEIKTLFLLLFSLGRSPYWLQQ